MADLRRLCTLTALLYATQAVAEPCPSDHQAATELRLALARADAVWAGEADGVVGMAEVVRNTLICAPEPLTSAQAATVHRTLGLAAAALHDDTTARRLFAVAKGLDAHTPPSRRSAGDAGVTDWTAAGTLDPGPSTDGDWRVDGRTTDAPPTDRPAVVQHLAGDHVIGTAWVDAGDPVPLSVACSEPSARQAFQELLSTAEGTFRTRDAAQASAAANDATSALSCLPDALSEREAAQLLRVHGAARWFTDPDDAESWLATARSIQPRFQLDSSVLPLHDPLSIAISNTLGAPPERLDLPPARGLLLINGSPEGVAASNRPWVVQHVENGVATFGALVPPGADVPRWPAPLAQPVRDVPVPERRVRPVTVVAGIGAATLLGVGAGLWGGANHSITTHCTAGRSGRGCPDNLADRATAQRTVGVTLVFAGSTLLATGGVLAADDLR